jgi:hypothetical protein
MMPAFGGPAIRISISPAPQCAQELSPPLPTFGTGANS